MAWPRVRRNGEWSLGGFGIKLENNDDLSWNAVAGGTALNGVGGIIFLEQVTGLYSQLCCKN